MWSNMLAIVIYLIFIVCVSCMDQSEQYPETECGSFKAVSEESVFVDDRIRNANSNTKLVDIGGMASLHNSDTDLGPGTHRCGGILISRNFLLTAAHCMDRNGTERITTISLGRYNLNHNPTPGPDTYKVEKVYYPTGFVSATHKYDDIALIKTDRPVLYKKEIWPLCLPESKETFPDFQYVDIAGWGQVNQVSVSSPTLQIATIKLIENSRCEDLWRIHAPQHYNHVIRKYDYPNGLTEQVLCAGAPGIDACNGDSGGPLSYQDSKGHHIVIGIVARGLGTCPTQPIVPGFYTNIGNYVDWIYDITWLPRRNKSTTISTQQASPPLIETCTTLSCPVNGRCNEGSGTHGANCVCNNGYRFQGSRCIETCTTLSCPVNGRCNEGSGTREATCVCNNGYRFHGSHCIDVKNPGEDCPSCTRGICCRCDPNMTKDHCQRQFYEAASGGELQYIVNEISRLSSSGLNQNNKDSLDDYVNLVTNDGIIGTSPLIAASAYGHVAAAMTLINAGANVGYARPSDGFTALHCAAVTNNADVARLLLDNGADKKIKNKRGQTAADVSRSLSYDSVTRLIDNY